jgi:hypothetical protein
MSVDEAVRGWTTAASWDEARWATWSRGAIARSWPIHSQAKPYASCTTTVSGAMPVGIRPSQPLAGCVGGSPAVERDAVAGADERVVYHIAGAQRRAEMGAAVGVGLRADVAVAP